MSRCALRELLDKLGGLTGKHPQAAQSVGSPTLPPYGLRPSGESMSELHVGPKPTR
jgi:hypothetical protein